jgi:hypothetical protein
VSADVDAGRGPDAAGRRAEIARILALGYLRLIARRNSVELSGDREPDGPVVDAGETRSATAAATSKESR